MTCGTEGLASYHLNTNGPSYCNLTNNPWYFNDGTKVQGWRPFDDCHFDLANREFRGKIPFEVPMYGCTMWDYDFKLSEDLQTIESGQITYTNTNGTISYGAYNQMFF